jgi:hypothetical protein
MNNNQRINQLLMQTRGLSSTNLEGTALIERLRKEAFALAAWSCREIDRITAERDEARRSCCEFAAMVDSADTVLMYVDSNRFHEIAMRYMKSRGWDCYKEDGK